MTQCLCRITSAKGTITTDTDLEHVYAMVDQAKARRSRHFIGIIGTRRRDTKGDYDDLEDWLTTFTEEKHEVLVSGACPKGADNMAANLAKHYGLAIIEFLPEWERLGKRAGYVRNEYIATACDELVALVAPDRTGGTEDTIRHAERLGRPVTIL